MGLGVTRVRRRVGSTSAPSARMCKRVPRVPRVFECRRVGLGVTRVCGCAGEWGLGVSV